MYSIIQHCNAIMVGIFIYVCVCRCVCVYVCLDQCICGHTHTHIHTHTHTHTHTHIHIQTCKLRGLHHHGVVYMQRKFCYMYVSHDKRGTNFSKFSFLDFLFERLVLTIIKESEI